MNKNYYSKNLDENEEVIKVVRQHPITMTGSLVFNSLLILIDFFFLTWLFSQGWWAVLVFFFFILMPSLFMIRSYVIWSKNLFLITNKRVIDIDQHGLFHKVVSECNYEKIQDVSFTIKGIFATLFKFGKIEIQTAGSQTNLEIRYVKNPHQVQELISEEQRKVTEEHNPHPISDEELEDAISKVKKRLDDDTLKKLFKE